MGRMPALPTKAAAGVMADVFHIAVVLKAAADHDVVGGAVGGGKE